MNNKTTLEETAIDNRLKCMGGKITPVEAGFPPDEAPAEPPTHYGTMLNKVKAICNEYGVYTFLPTEELLQRVEVFYTENWARISAELKPLLSDEIISVIEEDYARVLAGIYEPTATIEQMEAILKAVSPEISFRLERYGFYVSLLLGYSRIISIRDKFIQTFRAPITVEWAAGMTDTQYLEQLNAELSKQAAQKEDFMSSNWAAMDAQAFNYLVGIGEVTTSDFAGIDVEKSIKFLDKVSALSLLGNYISFYVIAKECINATKEELGAITPPPLIGSILAAMHIAGEALQELKVRLAEVEKYVTAVYKITDTEKREQALQEIKNARTSEERQQAIQNALRIAQEEREQIRQQEEPTLFTPEEQGETPAPVEDPQIQEGLQVDNLRANMESADIVRFSETVGLLLSRGLYASKDGKQVNDILPISAFIEDYVKRKELDNVISPYTVSKAVEGVNLLQRIQRVRPEKGVYEYNFNMSQFAALCGYKDANDREKKGLFTALCVLDGLYLITWDEKGRHAVRLLTIQKFDIDDEKKIGDIKIFVTAEAIGGRPNLLTWEELESMRNLIKSETGLHFRYQILSKGHIKEDALLSEVFGYDIMEAEAYTSGGTDIYLGLDRAKAAQEYIRKHKSRDRKRLKQMFDYYVQNDFLQSYELTTNRKGEKVYKWVRGSKTPKPVLYDEIHEKPTENKFSINDVDEQ